MTWKWVNKEIFWKLLLQHVSYLIPWVGGNPVESDQSTNHSWCQSHANISSPCCGLSRASTALILARPNVVTMEGGQTNNPWDESRTGGNPFSRCQTRRTESLWRLGSWEEQSREASFGSRATQTHTVSIYDVCSFMFSLNETLQLSRHGFC